MRYVVVVKSRGNDMEIFGPFNFDEACNLADTLGDAAHVARLRRPLFRPMRTTCPLCRSQIDPDQPDAVPIEKVENHPAFDQEHDAIWSRVGYAHERCLVGAPGYRAATEPT